MAKKQQQTPKNYEEAERELTAILTEIEAGEIGLEDSLTKYERGRFILQYCRSVLERAEQQIELLGKSVDGGLKVGTLRQALEVDDPTANDPEDANAG